MTLRQAMITVAANGDLAAKRPSMAGYIRRAEAEGQAEDSPSISVEWKKRDGSGFEICLDRERRTFGVAPGVALTSELFTAMLAEDWEAAPADDLERARTGSGEL